MFPEQYGRCRSPPLDYETTYCFSIVTREPRRTYTQDCINDIAALLEPLIYMSRAHEESATKSFRLKDAWAKKKERAAATGCR